MEMMIARIKKLFAPRRAYFDYAAATPVRPEVVAAMRPYASDVFANPSAIHREGIVARRAVSDARERIARTLRCRADEILFTSGGTEANNIAIFGVVEALHTAGRAYEDMEILTLATEHPSILKTCEHIAARGVSVRVIPLDEEGLIDFDALSAMLSLRTVLVTCAYANSEIGVVQDIKKMTRIVRGFRAEQKSVMPYVHVDASQAPLYLPCGVDSLGIDLMTLDAGKCYGPKGAGVLFARSAVALSPHLFGGDQEKGIRPGTEQVSLIVGCAEALTIAQRDVAVRAKRVRALRDYFFDAIARMIPDAVVNGSREHRIANNVNISIPDVDGEFAVVTLDTHGVAASTKSACAGVHGGGSHVVRAITGDDERAQSTIRFTLGEGTTKREINRALSVLADHVTRVRARKELHREI